MTTRIPISTVQNNFIDAQQVTVEDLDVEQNFNNQQNAAIVNNFFGSGILLETPLPNVLFDTDILNSTQAALVAANNFDGTGITPTTQPSDSVQGNQIAVELTDSLVFGRFSTKVLIIGTDFNGNIQYDRFNFSKDDIQITAAHYT